MNWIVPKVGGKGDPEGRVEPLGEDVTRVR